MTAEEIKQSVTMGDVLARYGIKVNRNGMCCCPIHGEKHPSMKVYKDGYKCFACNSAGDVFSFVMAYEGVDFKTAFATLGGTYERQPNKTARIVRNKKFERRKTQAKRQEQAEKDLRKLLDAATFDCIDMIAKNPPYLKDGEPVYPDDWCFGQNNLPYLNYIFELLYINEDKGVNKANVIRVCQGIRRRAIEK